jgi:hypothetical protein
MHAQRSEDFMSAERTCPVCQSSVKEGLNECQVCGFKLVGATEKFAIPGTGGFPVVSPEITGKPHLTVTKGPLEGEVFYLEPMPVTIGRDPACDLFLNNMTVSRKHAIIERMGAQIVVRDFGSLNGTWVDGKVVNDAELNEGTLLQIGTFSMRYSSK